MNALSALGLLVGGLGLFLLGMTLMTDGLKLAAGPALHRILAGATRTRWHALGSGVLVTAMVQSSSAVTVAAIGFVNAGLLGLPAALWVLFGANVGTTMTGWVVALVGLKFKVEVLALPLVGLGMLLRLSGEQRRRGHVGTALAGFGLLFVGIATLQQAFAGMAGQVQLPQGSGPLVALAQIGIGALMTVLMQSSSASMTIALTAAQGGLIDLPGAAALVIGANIGTTVTALLAVLGATPNARRAAAAHVVFNLLTGAVALLLLPWIIDALGHAREALGLPPDPATKLALFHTAFNLLGVALMWPMADRLTAGLQRRFRAREDDEAQPRYLDDNVQAVPTLALDALALEIGRLGEVAQRIVRGALAGLPAAELVADRRVMQRLDAAVETFVAGMQRQALSHAASERLALLLRVERYHESAAEAALAAAEPPIAPSLIGTGPDAVDPAVAAAQATFLGCSLSLLAPAAPGATEPAAADRAQTLAAAYEGLKSTLLSSGADARLPLPDMEAALRRYSALRRAVQQTLKADRAAREGLA